MSSPPPVASSSRAQPRLKITLKLPQADTPSRARRKAAAAVVRGAYILRCCLSLQGSVGHPGSDIESEDEDDEDEDDDVTSTRSTSVATAGPGGRALTARQAVLRNVVDSSHVSLSASRSASSWILSWNVHHS